MTILIGFSFPDLVVLAADGRGIGDGNAEDVIDTMQKIYRTGFDLMAGAGRSDVIEAVITKLANDVPATKLMRVRGLTQPSVRETCRGPPDDHER